MIDTLDSIIKFFMNPCVFLTLGGVLIVTYFVLPEHMIDKLHDFLHGRKPISETNNTEQCIACSSTWVEVVAQGVYRCNKCDYIGGPGFKEYSAQKQAVELLSKPMHERRAAAASQLQDASLLMTALEGSIGLAIQTINTKIKMIQNPATNGAMTSGRRRSQSYDEGEKIAALKKIEEEVRHINYAIDIAGKMLDEDLSVHVFEPNTEFMLSHGKLTWHSTDLAEAVQREEEILDELEATRATLQHTKVALRKKAAEVKKQSATPQKEENLQF